MPVTDPAAPQRRSGFAAIATLAAIVWLATGCAGDAAAGRGIEVVDSAGITIASNPSPDDSAANVWWHIDEPALSIGGLDAEEPYALFRVTDALRLNDGRIVVASSASDDIRYFDAEGVHLHTSGRSGGGPGEYQNPNNLLRGFADSLIVVDATTRRISVLDPAGQFVRVFDIGETASIPRIVGRFSDGSLLAAPVVVLQETPGADNNEISRPPFTLVRLTPDTGAPDTLGEFPGAERVMRIQTSGGQVVSVQIMQVAFGKSPTFAVHGTELYVGAQDGDEIRVYDMGGSLVRIIRTGRSPEPVNANHLDAQWERMLEAMPEEMRAQQRAAGRNTSMPHGELMPSYGEIGTDLTGNLWVADYDDPTDPPGRWTIYDPEGRVLARIVLPERFDPYDAGEDWVLGREFDDLDIEYIRLYPIVK